MLPSIPFKDFPIAQTITAIGALGTAAFGIVDASKSGFRFINHIGLSHIHRTIEALTPGPEGANSLERRYILLAAEASWINGVDLEKQKCNTVSLILGHMIATNGAGMAERTNVDPDTLKSIAAKTLTGAALLPEETAVQTRFQLILNTLVGEAYQRSDQIYRNGTRSLAACVAVSLALAGGLVLQGNQFWQWDHFFAALLVGLLATPMAPIAKDLSSAVAAIANTLQTPSKAPGADAIAVASAMQTPRSPAATAVATAPAAPRVLNANPNREPGEAG